MEKRIAPAHRILKNSNKIQLNEHPKYRRECFGVSEKEYFRFDV